MAIEKLDARAARWPAPARWLYAGMKWSLVLLGSAMLTYHFARTWGWAAGVWMLIAPFLYGILQAKPDED